MIFFFLQPATQYDDNYNSGTRRVWFQGNRGERSNLNTVYHSS